MAELATPARRSAVVVVEQFVFRSVGVGGVEGLADLVGVSCRPFIGPADGGLTDHSGAQASAIEVVRIHLIV